MRHYHIFYSKRPPTTIAAAPTMPPITVGAAAAPVYPVTEAVVADGIIVEVTTGPGAVGTAEELALAAAATAAKFAQVKRVVLVLWMTMDLSPK